MLDLLEEEISQYERESGKENIVKNYEVKEITLAYN